MGGTGGTSDIHLQSAETGARIFFRMAGVFTPVTSLPSALAERLGGRIKFLARLKTWQTALAQAGRMDRTHVGTAHDIRVSTYPTVTGEWIVPLLFRKAAFPDLEGPGFAEAARQALEQFLQRPAGLLSLTGPPRQRQDRDHLRLFAAPGTHGPPTPHHPRRSG